MLLDYWKYDASCFTIFYQIGVLKWRKRDCQTNRKPLRPTTPHDIGYQKINYSREVIRKTNQREEVIKITKTSCSI